MRSSCCRKDLCVSLHNFHRQLSGIVVPDTASLWAASRRLMVADIVGFCKPISLSRVALAGCVVQLSVVSTDEILFRSVFCRCSAVGFSEMVVMGIGTELLAGGCT